MNSEEVKDLATPGSVWLRTDGAQVKVIFLTNLSLNPQQQQKYPPQVIYADANGKIFSRTPESFATIYTFLNVDPDLEKRVGNLIVFKATDYLTVDDPEDDEEAIVLVDDEDDGVPAAPKEPVVKPTVQVRQSTAQKTVEPKPVQAASKLSRELRVDFKLSDNEGYTNPALTVNDLAEAIKVYTRQPDEQYNVTVHRLSFALSEKVTMESLKEIFHPSPTVNTIDAFRVRTAFGSEIFVWDTWIGIYPEYSVTGLFATVYVGTGDSPVDTEPTPGADEVAVHTHSVGEINADTTAPVDEVVSIEQPQVDMPNLSPLEAENDAPVIEAAEASPIVEAPCEASPSVEPVVSADANVASSDDGSGVVTLADVDIPTAPEAPVVEVQAQVQVASE